MAAGDIIRRLAIGLALLLPFPTLAANPDHTPSWSHSSLATLEKWVEAAPFDALVAPDRNALDRAKSSGDVEQVNAAANALALRLARMHLLGSAKASERTGWRIADSDSELALEPMLAKALGTETLDTLFAMLRPVHPEYSLLRAAYAEAEPGSARHTAIGRNMERWRWMPRSLGPDYVLVNTAEFQARLWRDGELAGSWPVIVGTVRTPTPVFSAMIEGVIFNPWWNIPDSIVRESVGAMVRRNPAAARARGYVWNGGRYRQRPGPDNALGQMKLVMPNPYSVYMHDTPGKHRFAEEVRTFSHGCVRTGDAIGYAATLLEGVKTREEVDAIVASNATTRVDLEQPIPVYIAYFTAVSDDKQGVKVLPDVYNRDRRIRLVKIESECSGRG